MRWLIGAFISISIIALLCAGGFILHGMAYSQGRTDGYNAGYATGHTEGQHTGYNSGRTDGYQLGKQDGYEEGYTSGKGNGYELGFEAGYEKGVDAGLGHDYTLKDPTYKQAIEFLREDKTDKNEFLEDMYTCSHFAMDVCNSAESEGLRCAYVALMYSNGGHAIIAFDTVDKGLVYFEPQTDDEAAPAVGKRYYQCVKPNSDWYYEEPYHDDTIIDILVIW